MRDIPTVMPWHSGYDRRNAAGVLEHDTPFAHTAGGYAKWKADASYKDGSVRCTEIVISIAERSEDRERGQCSGIRCYGGSYCTNPQCPSSVECSDLVWAIKKNDLMEAVRLMSLMFGDHASLNDLADFIVGVKFS